MDTALLWTILWWEASFCTDSNHPWSWMRPFDLCLGFSSPPTGVTPPPSPVSHPLPRLVPSPPPLTHKHLIWRLVSSSPYRGKSSAEKSRCTLGMFISDGGSRGVSLKTTLIDLFLQSPSSNPFCTHGYISKMLHKSHPWLLVFCSQDGHRLYIMYQLQWIGGSALGELESSPAFSQKGCED